MNSFWNAVVIVGVVVLIVAVIEMVERWRGVMADEVLQVMPSAVHTNDEGFMSVDYSALGFEMTKAGDTP